MGRTRHRGLFFQPEDYSQIEENEKNRLEPIIHQFLADAEIRQRDVAGRETNGASGRSPAT